MAICIAIIAACVQSRHNCRSRGDPDMRLLIAMMKHETNTFSPVPTPLARFGNGPGPLYGDAAIRAFRSTGTGLGAYLDLAERERAEIVLPIAAGAPPSRPVDDAAYAHITDTICDSVARGGFDGIMLDLHGAMVTESLEDGEGQFLKRLRAIDPKTPIAVSLDMHANLYDEIIAHATVVTGYRTYPHIDTYETARLAGEILLRTIRGEDRKSTRLNSSHPSISYAVFCLKKKKKKNKRTKQAQEH